MLDEDFDAMMSELSGTAAPVAEPASDGYDDDLSYADEPDYGSSGDVGTSGDVGMTEPDYADADPVDDPYLPSVDEPSFTDGTIASEMDDYTFMRHVDETNARAAAANLDAMMQRTGQAIQQIERENDPVWVARQNAARNREFAGGGAAAVATARLDERVPVANPNYASTAMYTGAGQELLRQEGQYSRDTADSQLQEAAIGAEAEAAIAQEMWQAQIEQQAIEIAAANREEEQLQRIQAAMDEADAVAADYVRRNEIDPSKAWKKRGLGIKILAALGSLDGDTSHITRVIDEEVDAQKANANIRATLVDRANARISEEDMVFQRVLQRTGSMREAGEVFALGRLKAIAQQAQAMLAAQGVTTMGSQQGVMLAKLHQDINARTLKLQRMQAANAPFKYVPKIPKGSFQRKAMEATVMQSIKDQKDYDKMAVDALGERDKIDAAERAAAAKVAATAGKTNPAATRVVHHITNRFVDKTKQSRERLRMIDEFKQEFGIDIPAVSWGNRILAAGHIQLPRLLAGEDGRVARSLLKRIALSRLREETGAAYSLQEYEDVAENYFRALDEEDVWNELQAQTQLDQARVREEVRAAQVTDEGKRALAEFLGTDPGSMGIDLTGIANKSVLRPRSDSLRGMIGEIHRKYGVRRPVEGG